MIEVIDLDAHKEKCARCRIYALCDVGRRIAERQATALIDGHAATWKIKK